MSNKNLRNKLARKRHEDRMKRLSPSGITSNGVNDNRRKLNMTAQMDKIKRNANRRVEEQKRNFDKTFV